MTSNSRRKRNPTAHRTVADGEQIGIKKTSKGPKPKHKSYPNGIQVTFNALWQYWWEHHSPKMDREGLPAETTCEEFAELCGLLRRAGELGDKYPDIDYPNTAKAAGEKFQEIGNGSLVALDYFSLRWASELVDLPVGLFIMFTHLISRERRLSKVAEGKSSALAETKLGLLNLVDQISAFADQARRVIEISSNENGIFYEEFDARSVKAKKNRVREGEAPYLARLTVLKLLVDAARTAKDRRE